MECTSRLILLLLAVFSLIASSSANSGSGSGCGAIQDDKVLQDAKIEDFIHNFGEQLEDLLGRDLTSGDGSGEDYEDDFEQQQLILDQYNELQNISNHKEPYNSCQDGAFFAKPVTTFSGSMAPKVFKEGSLSSPTYNFLAGYSLEFNFSLAKNLRSLSSANLLLFQEPTITNTKVQPRDYRQFVVIRTVFNGQRHIIENKYVETFGDGYKTFEITGAVSLWLDNNISGDVTIEVLVLCNSSPDCNETRTDGTSPAKVQFLQAGSDDSKAPRIIVVSENPLEHADARIQKRNTGEDMECGDEERLCCLKPLKIHFHEDLRMYNVLQPLSFDANYCKGICPIGATSVEDALDASSRYDFIRSLGNNHPAASIKPCCAGAKYKNLDIVMKIPDRASRMKIAVLVTLHQVTVQQCRCG